MNMKKWNIKNWANVDTKKWDEAILRYISNYKIAGLSIAVTDREQVIYTKGYGLSSVEQQIPVTPDTLFRIASITKLTTGIVALNLVDQGLLELDTSVKKYVPWLTLTKPGELEKLTLRHLLSHTPGLPSEYTPDGPHDDDKLESILMETIPELEMIASPDDNVYYYCNWGIRLVSYIIEQVTGKKFTELVEEYVLKPLQMDRSTFDLCVAATYPLAQPHIAGVGGEPVETHFIPVNATRHATGGLFSTAKDLAKLARMLLNNGTVNGKTILSPRILAEMKKPQTSLYLTYENQYGLTMRMHEYKGIMVYGHNGQAPPYFSSLWVCEEAGLGVVTLLNTSGEILTDIIPEMIFTDLLGLPDKGDSLVEGDYYPELEAKHAGLYLGDAQGLFELVIENNRPLLHIKGERYPLVSHLRSGVYYYFDETGTLVSVGLPGINGGSFLHIFINGGMCRKVTLGDLPPVSYLLEYEGVFGTVMDKVYTKVKDGQLMLLYQTSDNYQLCQYICAETFSSLYGAVSFLRMHGEIVGIKISNSNILNKIL